MFFRACLHDEGGWIGVFSTCVLHLTPAAAPVWCMVPGEDSSRGSVQGCPCDAQLLQRWRGSSQRAIEAAQRALLKVGARQPSKRLSVLSSRFKRRLRLHRWATCCFSRGIALTGYVCMCVRLEPRRRDRRCCWWTVATARQRRTRHRRRRRQRRRCQERTRTTGPWRAATCCSWRRAVPLPSRRPVARRCGHCAARCHPASSDEAPP
jgi:hypothetical protein